MPCWVSVSAANFREFSTTATVPSLAADLTTLNKNSNYSVDEVNVVARTRIPFGVDTYLFPKSEPFRLQHLIILPRSLVYVFRKATCGVGRLNSKLCYIFNAGQKLPEIKTKRHSVLIIWLRRKGKGAQIFEYCEEFVNVDLGGEYSMAKERRLHPNHIQYCRKMCIP